ncbi:hypothetical protein RJT34_32050 [Clitoria ternatea]|uniref:Uncharacterized protein n=1 Tax=Clitoria ternatea TaxID=43366 RepID=A0AAN9EW64_CLITE
MPYVYLLPSHSLCYFGLTHTLTLFINSLSQFLRSPSHGNPPEIQVPATARLNARNSCRFITMKKKTKCT